MPGVELNPVGLLEGPRFEERDVQTGFVTESGKDSATILRGPSPRLDTSMSLGHLLDESRANVFSLKQQGTEESQVADRSWEVGTELAALAEDLTAAALRDCHCMPVVDGPEECPALATQTANHVIERITAIGSG